MLKWKPKKKVVIDESSLPTFKNVASGTENFKPMPNNDSKQPKSVSTFDYNSKNSNHLHPIPTKSQQGPKLQDGIAENGKQIMDISKPEDTNHSYSITRFDICPKKVNTGVIMLKASLLVKNREKRNQITRIVQGPSIYILRPGMVLLKRYMSLDDQVKIVKACRELGIGDGGFYQPGYNNGAKLHFKMMCLGMNWDPQSRQYSYIRITDNSKPPKIPDYFQDMVKRAIQDSNDYIQKNSGKIIPSMSPDICIAKFYTKDGKLGLHQDKDESRESLDRGLPVVSFSIGDSAEFLYGNERDIEKADLVKLESGDVMIFGGESRNIFHGVSSIVPDTASRRLLEATDIP
ncbi:hypothetical protein L2E82_28096 [Cichorium intybus]|uniref:Uncharacterized protein n=1 Tax=Cichorium intybus TaxID=13427 RepID=A0ACB9CV92_CICIN|nr:hypothetical protein L2E82_28096 [Cichorium intybus]